MRELIGWLRQQQWLEKLRWNKGNHLENIRTDSVGGKNESLELDVVLVEGDV